MSAAAETNAGGWRADDYERRAYITAVRRRLTGELRRPDGRWIAPYMRLRFIARKPV